ncbi:TKL protein kinase [Salpingoeca rosetta]|uniref:TKL protein kinase n=1 Tax=Salpingoeca rosetta (strain ATCC 50818 / BSB-021) TaxID=946362 RepID=F2U3N2_SALR5|nr:TKL protein kinase [Salpingoeca rosetta]EGD82226.1 TKL protein kinase [Salpingoeca rosetta]|eukprot:XP_004996409.1 TKL protein kinase [Salpingoeca rosetta]
MDEVDVRTAVGAALTAVVGVSLLWLMFLLGRRKSREQFQHITTNHPSSLLLDSVVALTQTQGSHDTVDEDASDGEAVRWRWWQRQDNQLDVMEQLMQEAGLQHHIKELLRSIACDEPARDIELIGTTLGTKGAQSLAIAFDRRNNKNIEVLRLYDNLIGSEDCVLLADALQGYTDLRELHIGNNPIGPQGCQALATALRGHSELQELLLINVGVPAAHAVGAGWPEARDVQWYMSEERELTRGVEREEQGDQLAGHAGAMSTKEETIRRLRDQLAEHVDAMRTKEETITQLKSLFNLDLNPARFEEKKRAKDHEGKPIKGAFGKLYRSTFAGHDVALKEVDDVEERPRLQHLLEAMSDTATSTSTAAQSRVPDKRVLREVAVLASLRHPNIVSFLGLCHDSDRSTLAFVLSWAENGSLYDYIHVHKKHISNVEKLRILSEVAAAMEFLHAHDVVHRDLKSPNVLLDASLSAKVADFGLSAFVPENASVVSKVVGTPLWASPEQLLEQPLRADTDVFSFGCIMWEVWFNTKPWHHGEYSGECISGRTLGDKYKAQEYLPLDVEEGRKMEGAFKALLRGCFQSSGNRVGFYAVWKFPQQLLAAVQATELSTRQSVHIAPLQPDEDAVIELLRAAGGRTAAEPNPLCPFGRMLCRVAITWCEQKLVAFNGALHRNNTRYRGHLTSAGHPFAPKYAHDTLTGQATDAEERAVLERVTRSGRPGVYNVLDTSRLYNMLDANCVDKDPPIRLQRVFHGVRSLEAVVGILGGDFAQLQTQGAKFGAGCYFTPDLDYALAYTSRCRPSHSSPPELHCLKLEPGKAYRVVLACDVMYGNPYPVTHKSLHLTRRHDPERKWRSFRDQPLISRHDAHVAVIDFTSGDIRHSQPFHPHTQWDQGGNVPAAEIVVTDPSCVLVRAVLVFEA